MLEVQLQYGDMTYFINFASEYNPILTIVC